MSLTGDACGEGAKRNAVLIARELEEVLSGVDESSLEKLEEMILASQRVFFSGAGRSMLMLKSFAMRLMQIGFTVYVKGEVVTPAITGGDLLIIGSGSGETPGLVIDAGKVHSLGAKLALITTNPSSTIGQLADVVVKVPVETAKKPGAGERKSIQPGASAFEQSLLLIGDGIVMRLIEKSPRDVMSLHANLE
ncbi:MAG: 6-phospho-3-hexuloisomerase [Clostridia bacterium]|nr:6-phospho-3-hexuloisomerase [Clostridia bacterium]